MSRTHLVLLAVLALAPSARAQTLADVLAHTPPDSLVVPLRRLEARSATAGAAGEAAFALGQLHYARGEYHQAADAFGRAAARWEPARKGEARYWAGLSWLGAADATQARAALEEVARSDPARRGLARLGVALAWELAARPDRALDELERLVNDRPGEAGPAALAHLEALATQLHHADQASRASERLMRDWPASFEAARARARESAVVPVASAEGGTVSVQVGAFADPDRARALADAARRAGFGGARVVAVRGDAATMHVVRIGDFPSLTEAQRAGEKAAQALGVAYRVVKP